MKKYYLLILFLPLLSVFAQTTDTELDAIANAEKKSAFKKMNLRTNPDTYNYDVTYHKLEFTIDPEVYSIAGKVTTTYTALSNMNTLIFDLAKITNPGDENYANQIVVSSVKKNNVPLTFTRNDTELIITLPTTQTTGTSATVEITYSGAPAGSGFGSFVTTEHNGVPVLWTLSEPFGARDWWPCKQDLNDKVNNGIDVYITAPTGYTSVANGLQQSKIDNIDGTTTTHFHHGYAIPAYLIAIACTDYQIYTQQGGLGTVASPFFPIVNYIFPEDATENIASVAVTPGIINFYETVFGAYPFRNEKYGHCQFGWGGGMEHTTVSFMTANNSGGYSRSLIAHEMGHQWFGDKVTCGSWKDIWLNEGWATYLASMVIQHFDGETAFITDKTDMINVITQASNGAVYLTDDQALDVNRIFSTRYTYDKGAMVLNMLRFKLGDTNFFQGVRNYLNDPLLAYGFAHTTDFQSHLEAASGVSLTEFFNDWVYNQGYPTYAISAHNLGGGQTRITINQTQSDPSVSFFEMPVPVRLTGVGGQFQDYVLNNTTNGQQFVVTVPFTTTGVSFNVKKDIISRSSTAILANQDFGILEGIALYPNPATSRLTLNVPADVSVTQTIFYNALGQTIKQSKSETIWDVSDLASGVYLVTVTTDLGSKQIKFIKN
jgi:aminopeptidase N